MIPNPLVALLGIEPLPEGFDNVERLIKDWPQIMEALVDSQAKFLSTRIVENLRQQRFEGPTARLATIKRKLGRNNPASNHPTDVWRDLGVLQALVTYQSGIDGSGQAAADVGIFEEDDTSGDRIIAAHVLEWGSVRRRVAARPLFRPTLAHNEQTIYDMTQKQAQGIIDDYLSGRFGAQAAA